MEDALARIWMSLSGNDLWGLNPCCNGRCTRTRVGINYNGYTAYALILVVMEDALAQLHQGRQERYDYALILVVMEDALALQNLGYALFKRIVRLDSAS